MAIARRVGYYDGRWSCRSQQIEFGDRVFLLRQGKNKPGIVAAGHTTSEFYWDEHWEKPDREITYVDVRWDVFLNPEREAILDRKLLDALPPMHWDTESSGIQIKEAAAAALEILWADFLQNGGFSPVRLADEVVTAERFWEGAVRRVTVNAYERDPAARQACIDHHGLVCKVCENDLTTVYGQIAEGFIHVHHLKPLGGIRKGYSVDPIKDLLPVCPNCHAMLHRVDPPLKITDLKHAIHKVQARQAK